MRFSAVAADAAARGVEGAGRRMVVVGRGDAPGDDEVVAGLAGGGAWVVVGSDGVVGLVDGGKVVVDGEEAVVVGVGAADSGSPVMVATWAAGRGPERPVVAGMAAVAVAGCRAYRQTEEAERPCGAEEEKNVEDGEHNVAAGAEEGRRDDIAGVGDTGPDGRCKEAWQPERWDPNTRVQAEYRGYWGHRPGDTGADRSLIASMANVAAWDL